MARVLKLAELPRVIDEILDWPEDNGDLSQLIAGLYEAFGSRPGLWGCWRTRSLQLSKADRAPGPIAGLRTRGGTRPDPRGNAQRLFYTLSEFHPEGIFACLELHFWCHCLRVDGAAARGFSSGGSSILARLGHSQHGEAFDTGPREKPWPMAGIGVAHFPITTKNPEVQHWFDQGNALLHSFWDYEAERAFRWCLKLEPDNAMAYWGLARASICAAWAATGGRRR